MHRAQHDSPLTALSAALSSAMQTTMGSALGLAGACDAVGIVMAMFPDHRLVQVEGCRAVEALADGDEENVHRLGRAVSVLFRVFFAWFEVDSHSILTLLGSVWLFVVFRLCLGWRVCRAS